MKDKDTHNLQRAFQLIMEAEGDLTHAPLKALDRLHMPWRETKNKVKESGGMEKPNTRRTLTFSNDEINALKHVVDQALKSAEQGSNFAESLKIIKSEIEALGDTPSMYQSQG